MASPGGVMTKSLGPFVGPGVATLPVGLPDLVVPGATRRFDARTPIGDVGSALTSWSDALGSGTFLTPAASGMTGATAPVLRSDAKGRYVEFVASSSQVLAQALVRPLPHTIISLGRWPVNAAGVEAITAAGSSTNSIQGSSNGSSYRGFSGTSLSIPEAVGFSDRVFLNVFNGLESVTRMDNTEISGNAGSNQSPVLSIGGWGTQFSTVNVRTVIFYPFALNSVQRSDIVAQLRAEYALS